MASPSTPITPTNPSTRRRRGTSLSSAAQSIVSATEKALETDLPPGFLAATADVTSKAPTIADIRRGTLGQPEAPTREAAVGRNRSGSRRSSRLSRDGSTKAADQQQERQGGLEPFPPLREEPTRTFEQPQAETKHFEDRDERVDGLGRDSIPSSTTRENQDIQHISQDRRAYTSGYIPPPKVPWTTSTFNALKGFWKWFLTPFGFLVTLYGLNVVAWGGMLFLLLCNASPAMCWVSGPNGAYFDCNDIDSPRRKWIEWTSQILNALFCVTGFGLAPWRFRDLWYILSYRITSENRGGMQKKMKGLRKLAGHYRGWFRLPGSQTLDQMSAEEYLRSVAQQSPGSTEEAQCTETACDVRLPLPLTKAPDEPLTGVRAPPTNLWKMDFFIWCQIGNTGFQIALCYYMWGMDRFTRPPWATGLFVALACIAAAVGGIVSYVEGRKVKRVEGVLAPAVAQEVVGAIDGSSELDLQHTRSGHESTPLTETKKVVAL